MRQSPYVAKGVMFGDVCYETPAVREKEQLQHWTDLLKQDAT